MKSFTIVLCFAVLGSCAAINPAVAGLNELFRSTNGANWKNNAGWGSSTDPCTWYGITCDASNNVINVQLMGNGLTGTLTSGLTIGQDYLKILDLTNNAITGAIPSNLGDMKNIMFINLGEN